MPGLTFEGEAHLSSVINVGAFVEALAAIVVGDPRVLVSEGKAVFLHG